MTLPTDPATTPRAAAPSIIQDTNVVRVVEEAVTREYPAVIAKIASVRSELAALTVYAERLHDIARAAGVDLPEAE